MKRCHPACPNEGLPFVAERSLDRILDLSLVPTAQLPAGQHSVSTADNIAESLGLRFALVHDWMAVAGGAEAAFREICEMFAGPVYTSQIRSESFPWLKGREVRTSFVQNMPMALTRHYMYAPLMPGVYRGFDLSDADVVLTDSHSFAHHCRPRPDAIHVCYYHTTARSLWTPEIDDRARSGRLAWARRMLAPHMKELDLKASRHPRYVIANSKTTADRLRNHYRREPDEVIYPPVDTAKWADVKREDCDEGLVIWGRLVSYKRVDLAIEAVRITGDKLNIVGSGPMEHALKEQARGMPNVRFHGHLPDQELKKLLSCCWAVIFPGYEDFGLVPVEAMACGVPVVAYALGGASETISKDAGILVKSQTPEAFADGIQTMRKMEFDPATLRARARLYDASVFRDRYAEAVRNAIESRSSK